jgi:iron complex transport system permease protein
VLVFVLGSVSRGGLTPVTLALAGAAVSAMLAALTSAVILIDVQTLDAYRFWAVGSVAGRAAAVAGQVQWFLLVGALIGLASAPALNALALGDDVARGLGQNVGCVRFVSVVCVVLLAGAAVGVAGPVAFLGLIVPHIVRKLTATQNHLVVLPVCMVAGAALLLYADIVSRHLNSHVETPAGVVVAPIGALAFIYLARREKVAS